MTQDTDATNSSLSAFLFLEGNGTTSDHSAISLAGLPATLITAIISNLTDTNTKDQGTFIPSLASVLVCDPRMNITGGLVTIETNNSLRVHSSDQVLVGNIPLPAARIFFSQGLIGAVDPTYEYVSNSTYISVIAAKMFTSLAINSTSTGIGLLDLDTINSNMNIFTGSAAKAYADGYYPADGSLPITNATTMPVNDTIQQPRIMLKTSQPLWIIDICLVMIVVSLLATLTLKVDEGHKPFDLGNVLKAVHQVKRISW